MEHIKSHLINNDIQYTDFVRNIKFTTESNLRFKVSELAKGFRIEAQNMIDERIFAIFSGIPSERRAIESINYLMEALSCEELWH